MRNNHSRQHILRNFNNAIHKAIDTAIGTAIRKAVIEPCEQRLLMSTYVVNTTSDSATPVAGQLTLRQAVVEANADSHSDAIVFSPSVFTTGGMHTIVLTQGELNLSGTTTIDGPGANSLTIDGNKAGRVFQVSSGANVIISGLTITDGVVAPAPGQPAYGGAIANAGGLQLNNDIVSNSNASGGSFIYNGTNASIGEGGPAAGGAIFSTGTLAVTGSLITGNTAAGGASYGFSPNTTPTPNTAQGGGIYSSGNLTISGSTITGNSAIGGQGGGGDNGAAAFGGGIYQAGALTLSASTISNNTARGGAGTSPDDNASQNSGANASGGGIYVTGASNFTSVTFSGDATYGGASGGGGGSAGAALGGALWTSASLQINSTTFTANIADGGAGPFDDSGPGGDALGGAVYTSASFNLSGSTLTDNTSTGGDGQAAGTEKASGYGGAIYSTSTLAINTSTISGNIAQGDPNTPNGDTYAGFGGAGEGGGVFAGGTAYITSSTVSGNQARGGLGDKAYDGGRGADGGVAMGGGLYTQADLTITDSTFAGNNVTGGTGANGAHEGGNGGNGGAAAGGAVYSAPDNGQVNFYDSTISGNTATSGTAGLDYGNGYLNGAPGSVTGAGITVGSGCLFENDIVSGNLSNSTTEDDIAGIAGGSNNLIGTFDGDSIVNGVNGNITGINNLQLSPLGNYGGPTETMPPLLTSPAINAGNASLVPAGVTTDQRGNPRTVANTTDIGSVELAAESVSGSVINDLNGSGVQTAGDPGLGGITVYADLGNVGYYQSGDPTTTTNSSGNYVLNGLPEGAVIIRQTVPSGYRQSYPVGGNGDHVTVSSNAVTGALFADSTRLYISGAVSENGTGQGAVLVYADLNNDVRFESNENNKTTAGNGTYAFESLTAGTYTFRAVAPAGEVQTVPANNAGITVTLGSGGVDLNVNFSFEPKAATPKLTGTVIGTSGSYKNQGNTAAKAFDGNLSTFFDAPTASGSWAGLDLGSSTVITQISYAPRSGWASRMVGGMFQASNDPSFNTGVVTLYTVTSTPATGVLTTVAISNTTAFRYVRYIGPANSYCDIAEAQFFGSAAPAGAATLESNGTLLVNGTSGSDTINLSIDPQISAGNLSVNINGATQSFNSSNVSQIVISSGDGNDSIVVGGDSAGAGAAVLPPISITAGNGNDTITTEMNNDQAVGYVQEPIQITAGNGNDNIQLNDSSVLATVVAGDGSDQFTTDIQGDGDLSATISAGNGNDSLATGTSGGSGSQHIIFNAGTGTDTVANYDLDDHITGTLAGQAFSLTNAEVELSGKVYVDSNGDGVYEPGEPLVAGAPVSFVFNAPEASDGVSGTFNTSSGSNGLYMLTIQTDQYSGTITGEGQSFSIGSVMGEALSNINIALPSKLTGTVIGTSGSYNNQGNTAANAFDGNLNTFFDAPTPSGSWAGLDLGQATVITQISYAPRSGWASRMVGGMFQASNDPTFNTGVVTLYTVTTTPAAGVLTTVSISNTAAYRYVRYIGPANSYCDIAEAQFFGNTGPFATVSGNTLTILGTAGSDNIAVNFLTEGTDDFDLPDPFFTTETFTVTVNDYTANFNNSSVSQIIINSGQGNDTINVTGFEQGAGPGVTPASYVDLTINAGDGSNQITTQLGHDEYSFGNPSTDVVTVNVGNGDNAIDLSGGHSQIVNAGNGDDTVNSSATNGPTVAEVSAGNGNDAFSAGGAGDGGDSINVAAGTGMDSLYNTDSEDAAGMSAAGGPAFGIGVGGYTNDADIAGQVNVPNVQLYIDQNDSGVYQSGDPLVTADSSGNYVFANLSPSYDPPNGTTYDIRVIPPTGYTVSSPQGGVYSVAIRPGAAYSGIDFTLKPDNLKGTVIGTSGSYNNQGNTAAKAFDGNLNTYFDAPTPSGGWAGLDLGSPTVITQISYAPRSGWASRMVGGMFQGSNSPDFSSGNVTLYTITSTPQTGVLTTVSITNWSAYRYVRYIGPANSYCNIAEAQFFGTTPTAGASLEPDGTLVVNGSAGADSIHVQINSQDTVNPDTVIVTINGNVQTFSLASTLGIVVNPGAGNDSITLDGTDQGSEGNVGHGYEPVTINGGSGNDMVDTNLLLPSPTSVQTNNLVVIAGSGNDQFMLGDNGSATLIGGTGQDTFSTSGDPGLVEYVYGGSGHINIIESIDTTQQVIQGGSGGVTLDYSMGNSSLGVPQINLNNYTNVHNVILGGDGGTVIGTSGDDTITDPVAGASDVSIIGGGGNDTISVNNGNNVVVNASGVGASNITVHNSTAVTVIGGSGNDVINVRGNTNANINGSGGVNTAYTDPQDIVTNIQILNPDQSGQLTGTPIGTPGSYRNHGTTIANVFDGNLSTYFDGPDATGDWVGLDLGSPTVVTQVKYAPRAGWESRMVGGEIQASNSANFSSGVVTLYTINTTPTAGVLTTATFTNTTAYRYYRYIGPANSYCDIAELELFG